MTHILTVSGTLRSNLDPFGLHDDARLWDALKRSYLVDQGKKYSIDMSTDDGTGSGSHTPVNRFTLDSPVEDEGANLSVGQVSHDSESQYDSISDHTYQRSLVSLARALVKDSKVLVLDEATGTHSTRIDVN